jgi:hypothetical protein
LNAAVLKTVDRVLSVRGFESLPLRSSPPQRSRGAARAHAVRDGPQRRTAPNGAGPAYAAGAPARARRNATSSRSTVSGASANGQWPLAGSTCTSAEGNASRWRVAYAAGR